MPDALAFKAASSFAGGISHQYLTCGALLGGIMIISMKYGRGENREDFEALQNGMELANKLMFKFKQEFGTLNCRDITGMKGNSLEEALEYSRSGLHDERCPVVCGKTARMVAEVLDELKTSVGAVHLIVNRVNGDQLPQPLAKAIQEHGLNLAGLVPADPAVNELDALGEPIVKLPLDSVSRRSLESILATLNGAL